MRGYILTVKYEIIKNIYFSVNLEIFMFYDGYEKNLSAESSLGYELFVFGISGSFQNMLNSLYVVNFQFSHFHIVISGSDSATFPRASSL